MLRRDIDPDGLRDLEFLVGAGRLGRIETLARRDPVHAELVGTLAKLAGAHGRTA